MIRKTLLTIALTAGIATGTAGAASAHECFASGYGDTLIGICFALTSASGE
jgi:uncharacterized membrane protein (DUF441 family)